jgi:hypothetical protein
MDKEPLYAVKKAFECILYWINKMKYSDLIECDSKKPLKQLINLLSSLNCSNIYDCGRIVICKGCCKETY